MKRWIATGMTAMAIAGTLGFASAAAQAEPVSVSTSSDACDYYFAKGQEAKRNAAKAQAAGDQNAYEHWMRKYREWRKKYNAAGCVNDTSALRGLLRRPCPYHDACLVR